MNCATTGIHEPQGHVHFQYATDVGRYVASFAVSCVHCGLRFRFLGVEDGPMDWDGARTGSDGIELHVGMHLQGMDVPDTPKGAGIEGAMNG